MASSTNAFAPESNDKAYVAYLVIVALAGWSLASYDANLLTLTMPDIAADLHLSPTLLGILETAVTCAELVSCIIVGQAMDVVGRRALWMWCLGVAAVFTGLTFFAHSFLELVIVRVLADGAAMAELAVSVTLVNEQVPAKYRGLLYSIVQGGWPVGLFLASAVFLATERLGWRITYVFGVVPILLVAFARLKVRESTRFLRWKCLRENGRGDDLLSVDPSVTAQRGRQSIVRILREKSQLRANVIRFSVAWIVYSASFVASNIFISFWLVSVKDWTSQEAARLLLVSGGVGFFFYIIGGAIGEYVGRRSVLILSGLLVAPLGLAVLLIQSHTLIAIAFFLLYQVTNGTWSGVGYSYQAECFPTRVRGVVIGWLAAMVFGGNLVGSILWAVITRYSTLTVAWLIIVVCLGVVQVATTMFLPSVTPGQELEEATAGL